MWLLIRPNQVLLIGLCILNRKDRKGKTMFAHLAAVWNPAHDLAETITTKPIKDIFFEVFEVFAVQFLMWLLIRSSRDLCIRPLDSALGIRPPQQECSAGIPGPLIFQRNLLYLRGLYSWELPGIQTSIAVNFIICAVALVQSLEKFTFIDESGLRR
jgi:hypothetical protein